MAVKKAMTYNREKENKNNAKNILRKIIYQNSELQRRLQLLHFLPNSLVAIQPWKKTSFYMSVMQSYDFFKYLFVKGRWPKLFVNQTISFSEKGEFTFHLNIRQALHQRVDIPSQLLGHLLSDKRRLVSHLIEHVILQCSDCWAKTPFKSVSFLRTSIIFLCPAKIASWLLIMLHFIPVSCHNFCKIVQFQCRLILFAINCHLVADIIVNACNATFQRKNS